MGAAQQPSAKREVLGVAVARSIRRHAGVCGAHAAVERQARDAVYICVSLFAPVSATALQYSSVRHSSIARAATFPKMCVRLAIRKPDAAS